MSNSRAQGPDAAASAWQPGRPVVPGVTRRNFLQATGLGAAAAAGIGIGAGTAAAATARPTAAARPLAAGLTGTISDLKHVVILMQENRSFDHYFGTPRRRPRVRRQAGPQLAEREQRLPAAGLLPDRPGVPAAVQPDRPDRRRPRPQLVRRSRGVEQRPVESVGRGQGRGDDGLLHPVRDPVPVRAGRRVHHLRRLPPGDHGADQPQPDVLLDRNVVRLDLQPERLQGRLRLGRQDGPGHHVPGAAAGGRGELAGLRQRPGRRQRQLPELLPG